MSKKIYLDYAASRPIRKEVLREMTSLMSKDFFGNAESIHDYGLKARMVIDQSTKQIKQILGASKDSEIIYTSGGTESNMLAFTAGTNLIGTVLVSSIEHPSVYEHAQKLKQEGRDVRFLPIEKTGVVNLGELQNELNNITDLAYISVMLVNNEIGTIQPVKKIFSAVKEKFPTAICHTDASQAPLFLDVSLGALGANMVTFCGHKIYGPKGIGVLYSSKKGILRPGTLSTELIHGFATAFVLANKERLEYSKKLSALEGRLLGKTSSFSITKHGQGDRAPLALNLTFNEVDMDSEMLVSYLNTLGISVSSKSACMGSTPGQSYVMDALGVKPKHNIRFSFGRNTTNSDIDYVAKIIEKLHKKS